MTNVSSDCERSSLKLACFPITFLFFNQFIEDVLPGESISCLTKFDPCHPVNYRYKFICHTLKMSTFLCFYFINVKVKSLLSCSLNITSSSQEN